MRTHSKWRQPQKIIWGSGLRSQPVFSTPFTSKSYKWLVRLGLGWFGSAQVGSSRLGPIATIRLSQPASRAGAWAWLSLAKRKDKLKKYVPWILIETTLNEMKTSVDAIVLGTAIHGAENANPSKLYARRPFCIRRLLSNKKWCVCLPYKLSDTNSS